MRFNKKGFTLVEMLTAITVMGILMLVAGAAVTVYLDRAKATSYTTMAQAARQSAEEYIMEYPGNALEENEYMQMERTNSFDVSRAVTFDELVDLRIMKIPSDPESTSETCTGGVFIYLNNTSANIDRVLDSYSFVVHECCINNKKKYTFAQRYVKKGTREDCVDDTVDECEYIEDKKEEFAGVLCSEFSRD